MKLSDYKNFIKLFPTENSGYKIKKQNWLGTDQAKLIEEIFDNKTEIILTKEKIKKETGLKSINDSTDNRGIDFEAISHMNVHKLRHYAREFPNFPIKGREISRANRSELVELFRTIKNN